MRNTELRIDNGNSRFTVARLSGRLDTAGTGSMECELAEAAATRLLVVDLAQVDYISAVGSRLLLVTAKAIAGRGGQLVVINPSPQVGNVLRSSGLGELVRIGWDVGA
jgi:anti-anti-sigma factor